MRIACPIDDLGFVERSLEDTTALELYDIEEDEILSYEKVSFPKEALFDVLTSHDTDTLICSNMEVNSMIELSKANIEIVGGVRGKSRDVIKAWLRGDLEQNDIVCSLSSGGCDGNCSHCKR